MDRKVLQNFHKGKPAAFGNIQNKRELQSNRLKNDRHSRRTDCFNSRRNMGNEEDSKLNIIKEVPKKNLAVEASKVLDRKVALTKFKQQKEAFQKNLKKNVRPPFVVGIPHHGSSPLLRDLTNHDCATNKHRPARQEVRQQRVTRAMSKGTNVPKENNLSIKTKNKMMLKVPKDIKAFPFKEPKSVFTYKPKKVESIKKLTSPHTPTVLKRSAKKTPSLRTIHSRRNMVATSSCESASSRSSGEVLAVLLPEVEAFNATSPVQNEELPSSPIASLQHNKKQTNNICTQGASAEIKQHVSSPNVDSQGKRSDRIRTSSTKMLDPELQSTEPDVQISIADFHRRRLDDETRQLLSLADLWESQSLQATAPSEVIDEIDSLVGQTRLLTRDKFNQFRGLVDQFETGATTAANVHLITLDDLNGFWEMIYLQVEPLIKRYNALDVLKKNNWLKPKPPTPPRKKKRIAVKPKATPRPSAALRAAVRACRARPNQVTTPTVIQDSMKTPTTDHPSVVNSFLTSAKQPRNSNSPFIVMRLSGIGRSTGRSSIVGMDTYDHSTTPKKLVFDQFSKDEPKDSSDTSRDIECQNTTIKTESSDLEKGEEDCGINSIFELQANVSESTFTKTPRRSLRLLGKTPTPIKSRLCGSCMPPKCDSSEFGKENIKKRSLKKSSKTCNFDLPPLEQNENGEDAAATAPEFGKENIKKRSLKKSRKTCNFDLPPLERNENGEDAAATAPDPLEESKEANKPVGTRFALRPSNLILSERITFGTNTESSRRSVRISNARKVTFDACTEEKSSFKLPATPYRKSGVHQGHEDSNKDD